MNFIKNTYMYLTIITYIFFALAFFNISPYARKYYEDFSLYIKVFLALVLMWTFRPFHKKTTITDVEKRMIFWSAFLLISSESFEFIISRVKANIIDTENIIKNFIFF